MSEQDFELYLTLLAKTLRLSDKQRDAIASELRDHLEARLDELTAEGLDKRTAIQTALAEFGDASALANDFTTIGKQHQRRRIMQTTFGTLIAAAAVGFAAITLTPNNYQGNPTQPRAGAQDGAPGVAGESSQANAPTAPGAGAAVGSGRNGVAVQGGGRGIGRGGGMNPGLGRGGGEAGDRPRRELAIQAVVRDVPELKDLSIHVVDCTEILSPRADGLGLLDRTEALASAVEETVAAIRPHGPSEIQVRAFEEFLIITATDDAYAQAQDLLENISSHVQRRDAIQRQRDAAETQEAVNRIQREIDTTLADLHAITAEKDAVLQQIDAMAAEGLGNDHPDIRRLRSMTEDLTIQQQILRERRQQLELQRAELLPFFFGGC